ncbi:MAG: hotdog domain-containing protein [Aerococcus sp.]|nr:hotdog domain-containing protein [Aerococcus sp.]
MQKSFTVQHTGLANQLGSGSLPVLATPQLVADMENTAASACTPFLKPEQTTVGVNMKIDHLAPSLEGDTILIDAQITEQTAKKFVFAIVATCRGVKIGQATHTRVIVESERFMPNAKQMN